MQDFRGDTFFRSYEVYTDDGIYTFSDTDYIYTFINGSRELRCKISNTAYTGRDIICILEYTKATD